MFEIIQYSSFYVWLISLSTCLPGSSKSQVAGLYSFLWLNDISLYMCSRLLYPSIHPSHEVVPCLGCSGHGSPDASLVSRSHSSAQTPRGGAAAFLRKCHALSIMAALVYILTRARGSHFLHILSHTAVFY